MKKVKIWYDWTTSTSCTLTIGRSFEDFCTDLRKDLGIIIGNRFIPFHKINYVEVIEQ